MDNVKERLKQLEKGKTAGFERSEPKKNKKHKEKGFSQKVSYTITMSNFFSHVFELILTINNIDEKNYLSKKDGAMKRNIKLNKKFKQLSGLDWDHSSEIGSFEFNGKLATVFLFHILYEVDHLIARTYSRQYRDEKRFKIYNMLLNKLIERTDFLVVGLLTRDFSYAEPMQAMTQMLILANGNDGNILRTMEDSFKFLEKEYRNPSVDEGVVLNNVMKTAYILATMNMKLKKTPKFIEGDYRNDDDIIRHQVAQLGFAIMKAQSKGAKSLFYDIMIEAKPKIMCRFPDVNEFPELCVGYQALTLLTIYMDNDDVTRWVKKMM